MDNYDHQADTTSGENADEHELPREFRLVAQRYAAQPVPRPTPEATQRLLSRLLMEETMAARATLHTRPSLIQSVRVARWQLRLLGPWFWMASVLLLLVGCLAASGLPKTAVVTLLIFVLPLTAILSVAYALRTLSPGLREVEVSCPTGFVETMAGVVMALVCFDGLLGLLATAALATLHWAPFGPLLASWLGPLLLLVGLSFPVALRWGTLPAIVVGGGPWLLLVGTAGQFPGSLLSQFLLGGQGNLSITAHVLVAGLGALILLLLLVYGSTWQRVLVR